MASFDVVNYSLRPSKSIQRQLVFEGVRQLRSVMALDRLAYIGFGSIWFTDFVLAHRLLDIEDMVSIEGNEIGFARATFNAPYATVRVMHGISSDILPMLYIDHLLSDRPWMIWLDYDYEFDETTKGDLLSLIENAPTNSILLVTFNGRDLKYGKTANRLERVRQLYGASVPDDLSKGALSEDRMQETLADLTRDYLVSTAVELGRPGGFLPAFRIVYRDVAPMITVGGILPARAAVPAVREVISTAKWACCPSKPIVAPHLTIREAAVLQSRLPSGAPLDRQTVRALGFDLEEEQIAAFQSYYRHYPAFAQIIS